MLTPATVFYFLLVLGGSGKAAVVVGPFSQESTCNAVRETAAKNLSFAGYVSSTCWSAPLGVLGR